jgi:amidase
MEVHPMITIPASKAVYALSKNDPEKATCVPGETVCFQTKDCFSSQIRREQDQFQSVDWATINPATGPLYVEGAIPGDTLAVRILDIAVDSPGVMVAVPGLGALGHLITESQTKLVPIENGYALFSEHIQIPVDPMIGVIGTAPADAAVPCGTPGPHGGNMDTRLIRKGATVYLPVAVPGGLLSIGDLHAVMADGEVVVCGIEVSGSVTVRIELLKQVTLPCPVVEDDQNTYLLHSAATLDEACTLVLEDAIYHVTSRTGMSLNDAGMLLSLLGNLEVSQIVDPLKTARMRLPAWLLRKLGARVGE